MYNKDFIEKICNLICSKEDVCRIQTEIKYDVENPFKKYYDINIIVGAINKYLSKEWDGQTFAGWCCIYNWILCGGFSKNLKEDLNYLEDFLKNVIRWDLDGLSFFDEESYKEEYVWDLYEVIEQHKRWNYVWNTRESWHGIYATIGEYDKINGDQYVLLINEKSKEYIIIFSSYFANNYKHQYEYLKYTSKNKFIKTVEQLEKEFKIISCSEDLYYSDLYDIED